MATSSAVAAPYSRIIGYFIGEFMIRTVLPFVTAFDNDYEEALIFLVITNQNSQNLMLNQQSRREYASLAVDVPDELIRPVSRMAIARSTGLARETVRRKVLKLIERGFVEERPKGLVVPPSIKTLQSYNDTLVIQEANLRRLLGMVGDALASDPVAASELIRAVTAR
jgi:hypothetical protein